VGTFLHTYSCVIILGYLKSISSTNQWFSYQFMAFSVRFIVHAHFTIIIVK
jgi:hypothetical protein